LAKVRRYILVKGEWHTVELAVRADGSTCPARTFLNDLKEGMWTEDTGAEGFPDEAQIAHHTKMMAGLNRLAKRDQLINDSFVRPLIDGLWELRLGTARLSFFDTPGDGTHTPKLPVNDIRDVENPRPDYWKIPWFDEYLRLGHYWSKDGRFTHQEDLNEAHQVREEDLTHDQQN
jgi:hypothetical protein